MEGDNVQPEENEQPQQKNLEGEAAEEEDEAQKHLSEFRSEQGKQEPLTKYASLRERIKARAIAAGERAGRAAREAAARAASKAAAGFKAGKSEAIKGAEKAIYEGGRIVGASPLIIGRAAYGRVESRVNIARQAYHAPRGAAMPFHTGAPKAPHIKGVHIQMPGRKLRNPVPRGRIPKYVSKKLRNLTRQQIRLHGLNEGIAKARAIAKEAQWKGWEHIK